MSAATTIRLQKELDQLELHDLPAAQRAVAAGQGVGDINENTDVAIALSEVARVRSRIRQIKEALSKAISTSTLDDGVVGVGRLVELRFGDDDPETYLFGNVEDKHDTYATMTEVSPVGQEIIGKMSGDVVELSLNGHKEIIYILSVKEE